MKTVTLRPLKPNLMLNLVIFGPPGSGKGTQSEKLIQHYGLVHISTGNLFRRHTKNQTKLGKQINEIMNSGKLVSDDITISILKEEINKNPDSKGFLFDGFPRTVLQAEALDELLKVEMKTSIDKVLALEVTQEELRSRIAKRKILENRADDDEEKLNMRIVEYFDKTIHVLTYYKNSGKFVSVNGIGTVDEIYLRIRQVLDN